MPDPARVLIVDDSDDFRLLLRVMVDGAGCMVAGEASNGLEAVRIAQEQRPHLVLLDVHMPKMDGLTAVPELRRVSPLSRIVILSSDDDSKTPAQQLAADWLHKEEVVAQLPLLLQRLADGPTP